MHPSQILASYCLAALGTIALLLPLVKNGADLEATCVGGLIWPITLPLFIYELGKAVRRQLRDH